MKKPSVLVVIPARSGSKRIKEKNIRLFSGKPLLAYSILQALELKFIERVIVDTDSPTIAAIARKYGAEAPYLRPKHLASDTAQIADSILYLLERLSRDGYVPDYIMLLQTTSPLRETSDIESCWKLIRRGGATSVLTVVSTHPKLFSIKKNGTLEVLNKKVAQSSNAQAWLTAYIPNGFVYIIRPKDLARSRRFMTKHTKAVVCPRWRSVDIDTPEEWIMAESLYRDKKQIALAIKKFK